jgi:prolyl 4-hydroxylase
MLKNGNEIFPGVVVYDNVINNSKELIDLAIKNNKDWVDSTVVYDNENKMVLDTRVRSNKIFPIPATFSNDIEWFSVSKTIWEYANNYANNFDITFSLMESCQILHYSKNEFYKPHHDSSKHYPRIFSAILYLNDVDSGGETYFNRFGLSVSPKEGRLVLFPANYCYLHEAKPPLSNEKVCIVTWFTP